MCACALAALVAVVGWGWGFGAPVGAASGAGPSRAELLERIASLTDEADEASAGVVAGQMAELRVRDALAAVQARVRARAVSAYVRGVGIDSPAELAAPAVYLDVAARKEKALLGSLREARDRLESQRSSSEALSRRARAAEAELASARQELAAVVAAEAARQKALQQAADAAAAAAARRRALASADAAAAAARARVRDGALAGGGVAGGGVDVGGLLPRHIEATRRQTAVMGRLPFGVLAPGPLPAVLGPSVGSFSGPASWYGGEFNGRPTASGAIYDEDLWTAASRELPLGTLIVVSRGGVRVLLLVNDRGPYVDGRVLDLSAAAARALDVGVAPVDVAVFGRAPGL